MSEIDRIKRAHANARPKDTNPAWKNSHRDLATCLDEIERLTAEKSAIVNAYHEREMRFIAENERLRAALERFREDRKMNEKEFVIKWMRGFWWVVDKDTDFAYAKTDSKERAEEIKGQLNNGIWDYD